MIELRQIKKSYVMGDSTLEILKGIDLRIDDGEFVAIMGPSGSGKSTLMNILGLLDVPSDGSYKFNEIETAHMSEDELAIVRRREIGFIFQQFNLLSRMTAAENVSLPLLYSKQAVGFERAHKLLTDVGLESRLDHKPNELSGGQQQRVAIARALINNPRMILADEPTGNLDSKSEKEIMEILKKLNASGITVVIVTHEEEIGHQAKRLIRMRDGQILSDERIEDYQKADNSSSGAWIETKNSIKDFWVYFNQGFKTLLANKVRTVLSMLGVLIGVAAVVTILALGKGAEAQIKENLSSLGTNLLMVRPGVTRVGGIAQSTGAANRLLYSDADVIKDKIESAHRVSAVVSTRAQVTFSAKNWNTTVQGNSSDWAEMHSSVPLVGRFFTTDEDDQRARVAVIGATVKNELFGDQNALGEMIKINKVIFNVIGVLPAKGASGWRDQDDIILVPLKTAMFRLMGTTSVSYIEVEVDKPENMVQAQDSIVSALNTAHRIPDTRAEPAFEVRNMADIQEAMESTIGAISLLLSSIAAISLLVGGIGIMNIMLVSVTERTREIGLRKALGARANDILSQFLSESVVVSVTGGLMGVLLAGIISMGINIFGGWATSITLQSVVLAMVFSSSIGVVFGVYPALKAARLNPIDALRSD
ncbi:MacB family efflux pump subunit [Pseudobdellovibrio exovorus]|uniref:Macrolide ABC transporter ATP-binding protein n=1 Tax=Pseudobdellovibrio exovorus JSS TaxID=1184267 RepID=M4VCY6_9BACT|nr:MacB family efflux pump subunit [Pseudobdellovibrio exovorus]AGH96350.1 macrolide ABC transporter ATP-binding protein [Pseudobdellovibrio exovorus JSS]